MRRPLATWGVSIGALVALYAVLDKRYDGWTFSEALRPWAREHPALFAAGCIAGPVWFYRHIQHRSPGRVSSP